MTPFATDDQLAARLRVVAAKLRELGLHAMGGELAEIIVILDPEPAS